MVMFQRQLEAELVPEWRKAYCKYKHLKRDLKRIRRISHSMVPQQPVSETPVFSLGALARRRTTIHPARKDAIEVYNLDTSGSEDMYETKLLENKLMNDVSICAFFKRLDGEFNKVNKFYRCQEEEFIQRAQQLDKQIATLLQLKNLIKEQDHVASNRNFSVYHRNTDYFHQTPREQPAVDPVGEKKAGKEKVIHFLGSGSQNNKKLDDSGQDLSIVDIEKSIEESIEIPQVSLKNNETNSDIRNGQ
ncbi:hypothetical protein R1flu_015955 [Riccia fluitans]|uniref:SPX domain-containing protein n=1 Tax=Riccia fluitans TaxID=41844 RepID=A0ABD1YNL1_9MARC